MRSQLRFATSTLRLLRSRTMTSLSHNHAAQHWEKLGIAEEYDSSGGKLLRPPIDALLVQSGVVTAALNNQPVSLWDNACGTGNLASYFHDAVGDSHSQQCKITCTDFSSAMIESVKKRAVAEGWGNASVQVADAQVRRGFAPCLVTKTNLTGVGHGAPVLHFHACSHELWLRKLS